MAILKDCELWFPKLDAKRPNSKFDKENPTWDVQIRTTSKEVKKYWESLNLGVKAIVPDEGAPYFRVNLRKKSIKADGTKASPVTVVNGSLEAIEASTIGNGSRGNVRIFQYEYPSKTGKPGIASVLMAVQITKHVVYTPKPRDDEFGMEETEVVLEKAQENEDDSEFEDADF